MSNVSRYLTKHIPNFYDRASEIDLDEDVARAVDYVKWFKANNRHPSANSQSLEELHLFYWGQRMLSQSKFFSDKKSLSALLVESFGHAL